MHAADGRAPGEPDPTGLAARQADLVAALVAGGPLPTGFAPDRFDATRRALLRKRAGEAAKVWPLLAASLRPDWVGVFAENRDGHEPVGALRDGWDVARVLRERGVLQPRAAAELAGREAALRYDGRSVPRARLLRRLLLRRLLLTRRLLRRP